MTGTHLHLVVLVNLLAGARGRWETHVLEGDLPLRLPAGTEEEGRHIGKGARENLFTDIHISASVTCRRDHSLVFKCHGDQAFVDILHKGL